MLRLLVLTILLWLLSPAFAHDGHNDEWFRSLTNQVGFPCCDGSDAVRLEDPEWDIEGNHYRVRLDGEWQVVPPERLVKAQNIVGYAIVWPQVENGKRRVRCFMPGSGT